MKRRGLLVYDSNCKVCVRQVENLLVFVGGRLDIDSFREPDFLIRHPEIPLSECEKAIQFVNSTGTRFSGAEAVARALALNPLFYPLMLVYYMPGLRRLWDWVYRWIAKNRFVFSKALGDRK